MWFITTLSNKLKYFMLVMMYMCVLLVHCSVLLQYYNVQ